MKYNYNKKRVGVFGILGLFFFPFLQAQSSLPDSLVKEQPALQTIAYGTQPDWEVTGAISSIKGDELTKSFTTNVANTLYGRIPGLTVGQNNGEPGNDAPSLISGGISTFAGSNSIYIIIDGFPSTYELFQQLTPLEIESINLLKDASSAAIYGNNAANGVLLVKTKRGSEAPLKLNFGVQYGWQQPVRLPQYLDSYHYASLYNEARVNDYGAGAEVYTAADLEAYKNNTDPLGHPNVDWYNELLSDLIPLSNYNLSAIGGSKTVKYFVLLNVANNRGFFKNTEKFSDNTHNSSYTRYNFRTNVDIQLSERLNAEMTLGGSVEDRNNPGRLRNGVSGEYGENVFNLMATLPPNAFPVHNADGSIGGNSIYYNPLAEITETGYYSTNRRTAQMAAKLIGDLGMITPGLSIAGSIGFNTDYKSYYVKNRDYVRQDINGRSYGENSSMTITETAYSQWRNYIFQGFLNYDRTFGKHHLNALWMAAYEERSVSSTDLPFKDVASGGRLTYSFDQRYIGEFSYAYSGNDNFAPGCRFGFFPAGAIGWVVSNEGFLKENKSINHLKLRASYGLTGNKNTGDSRFPFNQYYEWFRYYLGETNTSTDSYYQDYYANRNATWEKDTKLNLGFQTTLLNKWDIDFDYFNEKRYDILTVPYDVVPFYAGFVLPSLNIGQVENKGFEATVRFNGSNNKNLNYFLEAGVWYAKNKIVYNAEAPKTESYLYETGNAIGRSFLLEAIGFYNDWEDIAASPQQVFSAVQPGDIKYKDQNGDKVIDENDYIPMAYPFPEYTLSFHAGINYKGFDLDVSFQGALNRSVYLGSFFEAFQNDGQAPAIALGRWAYNPSQGIDTRATATYPRLSSENNMNNYLPSSFWLKNGNFLKLRSLEIGYTIPEQITGKIKLKQTRIFLNGTNLFSLDHMDGWIDPEMTAYPATRTISMGIGIQL